MKTQRLKKTIAGNKYAIYTCKFSSDNAFLACGGEDKMVHFYDT
jgi:WD40 repeat protein